MPDAPRRPSRAKPAAAGSSLLLLAVLIIAVAMGWLPASVLTGGQPPSAPAPAAPQPTPSASRPAPSPPTIASPATARPARTAAAPAADTPRVADLFRERRSDTWVETSGTVERLLDDDRETRDGSDMHQRLILRTDDAITVLVAHNISVSPRVPARPGDRLTLRGEYEWTDRGGTIHFTHKPKYNPERNRDRSGWIEHQGKRYE